LSSADLTARRFTPVGVLSKLRKNPPNGIITLANLLWAQEFSREFLSLAGKIYSPRFASQPLRSARVGFILHLTHKAAVKPGFIYLHPKELQRIILYTASYNTSFILPINILFRVILYFSRFISSVNLLYMSVHFSNLVFLDYAAVYRI